MGLYEGQMEEAAPALGPQYPEGEELTEYGATRRPIESGPVDRWAIFRFLQNHFNPRAHSVQEAARESALEHGLVNPMDVEREPRAVPGTSYTEPDAVSALRSAMGISTSGGFEAADQALLDELQAGGAYTPPTPSPRRQAEQAEQEEGRKKKAKGAGAQKK